MKPGLLNARNVLLLVGITLQLTWYALLAAQTLADPAALKQVDYVAIYTGGYIARFESPSREYDLALQQQVEQQTAGAGALSRFYPYHHPPLLIHLLEWTTSQDYYASYLRWIACMLVFHLAALGVLVHLQRRLGWDSSSIAILFISGLLFYPAITSYLKGQDATFLLLAVSLWMYGVTNEDDRLAGLGLALATVRPQLAVPLAIPFLFNRRRVLLWFLIGSAAVLVYAVLSIGFSGLRDFVNLLMFSGSGLGVDVDRMSTLAGATVRAFPHIDPAALHLVEYGGLAAATVAMCVLWRRSPAIDQRHVGTAILLGMFTSPHMNDHDLTLWLIPALGGVITLSREETIPKKYATLLPLLVSVVLMLDGIVQVRAVIYVVMLALGVLLWHPVLVKRPHVEPAPG